MTNIYQEIARMSEVGEGAAVATVISASGSTPREIGAKMLVRADGSIFGTVGGGSIERRIIQEALKVIESGQPQRFSYHLRAGEEPGMICGGDTEIFVEPIVSPPVLYIFGAGHIGFPLAKMGKLLGFRIAVIDDRPEFANAERFPEADLTLAEDFTRAFARLKIAKSSYIVIVTHGHKHDEVVLEKALATPATYIGMIGSRAKVKTVFSHLLARGISQERLDRVHAPIGLEIRAETPEEIAVSILAEIIKIRRSPQPAS